MVIRWQQCIMFTSCTACTKQSQGEQRCDHFCAHCVYVCVCVLVFPLITERITHQGEARSSLWAQKTVKQGDVLRDMFYSPTSQFIFTSALPWLERQLCPGCPSHCSAFIVEYVNQYWTQKTEKDAIERGTEYRCCLPCVRLTDWLSEIFRARVQSLRRTVLFLCRKVMGRKAQRWFLGIIILGYQLPLLATSHFPEGLIGNWLTD